MNKCGCTPQWPVCAVGRALCIEAWCGSEVIESPSFVRRPLEEREAIWQDYMRVVDAYLRHCEYMPVAQAQERAGVR